MVLATDMEGVNQEGGDQFFDRLDIFANVRTNQGVMAIDKTEEELTNVSAPLGSLDHLQAQAQEQMCSVTGTPVVKLLGIQPTGLNATPEGELTCWYDWVAAFQEKLFRRHLTTVLDVLQIHLWGERDPDITFDFEPLEEMTETEEAGVEKTKADTDVALVGAGILAPEESRARIAADPRQPYGDISADDVPEQPGLEDTMGGIGQEDVGGGEQPGGAEAGGDDDQPAGLKSLLGQLSARDPAIAAAREGDRREEPRREGDGREGREGRARGPRDRARGTRARGSRARSWEDVT